MRETGPYGFLVKPFSGRDLQVAIEAALSRHAMVEQLRRNERWLDAVLRSIGDGVICTDAEGEIQFINEVAQRITGLVEGEQILQELHVLHLRKPSVSSYEEEGLAYELKLTGKDSVERQIECCKTSIEGGEDCGHVFTLRDVTLRKKYEAEKQKSGRLSALGLLAGGVAHDFNNILAGMLASISLAVEMTTPEDERRELLVDAENAAARAKGLTNQLLTLARGGKSRKKREELPNLVSETVRFSLRGKPVDCEFDFADELWPVNVDGGQLSSVINNLALNAAEAMPRGGRLMVLAENELLEEDNDLSLRRGQYIRLVFKDEGEGICEKNLDLVFDPYFTTKRSGAGMGLAMVYAIVNNHGGTVCVESTLGKGTTFTVYIPALDDNSIPYEDSALPVQSKRILVFDNDDGVLIALRKLLSYLGFEVSVAQDGKALLSLFKEALEEKAAYACVIMELSISGEAGTNVLAELKKLDKEVKAIVTSGFVNDRVLTNYSEFGFVGALPKPFNISDLRKVMSQVLSTN